MPSVQLPECTRKEGSQGTADEVGRHENCIDAVGGSGGQFEDTGLITELDALHTYVDDDNSQNDTKVGVFSDEEE